MTRKTAPFRDEDLKFSLAELSDIRALHEFGCTIPELQVSTEGDFMSPDEVSQAIGNPDGIMYVAFIKHRIVGFCYANVADSDRTRDPKHACLVYLAVASELRGFGIAARLYDHVVDALREHGVERVHALAHPTSGIIEFLERRDFTKGHPLVWMDGEL